LAGIAIYVVVDVILKFLRPGYSLLHNAESDYGGGPWFWVMDARLLAFFADDVEGQPVHGSGGVHIVLAAVAFLCVAIATVLLSVPLRTLDNWASVTPVLTAVAVLGAVAFLALGPISGHRHLPGGLVERIFLALELGWMAIAAVTVVRISQLQRPTAP
jgi:hypothetical membrane protein